MISGAFGSQKTNSLMGEYSSLLADAVLRQRTRAAEQTARLESELANKVKSEFISNMSHELRTPLNTVIGFSKILAEQDLRQVQNEEVVEYANLIHDAAIHLLTVINDILDISKIQSGRYTLEASELDVKEILQAQIDEMRSQATAAQIELIGNFPSDIPEIRGDRSKLDQAFANILSNAVKFTRPGGMVKVEAAPVNDDAVAIFIRDTGIGMTPDELQIAQQPFGQVDGSRTRWREGTGLGLPIAKSLVELHGGELEIRSQKDVGTEVVILLPSRNHVSTAHARDTVL
ncbi:MAG: HAMP domain-containing histidine kinase [Alphaproteobacteria bacterium]|nr:HAMP domain-containing histidine kinase [Alphaproteobacteria bacterium]